MLIGSGQGHNDHQQDCCLMSLAAAKFQFLSLSLSLWMAVTVLTTILPFNRLICKYVLEKSSTAVPFFPSHLPVLACLLLSLCYFLAAVLCSLASRVPIPRRVRRTAHLSLTGRQAADMQADCRAEQMEATVRPSRTGIPVFPLSLAALSSIRPHVVPTAS